MKNQKLKEVEEKVKNILIEQNSNLDKESAHDHADNALCLLLKELGYTEIVELFEKLEKYY